MGLNHFKVKNIVGLVIVTHQLQVALSQDPSAYLDPNNNYDNYNNDYSFHFNDGNSIETSGEYEYSSAEQTNDEEKHSHESGGLPENYEPMKLHAAYVASEQPAFGGQPENYEENNPQAAFDSSEQPAFGGQHGNDEENNPQAAFDSSEQPAFGGQHGNDEENNPQVAFDSSEQPAFGGQPENYEENNPQAAFDSSEQPAFGGQHGNDEENNPQAAFDSSEQPAFGGQPENGEETNAKEDLSAKTEPSEKNSCWLDLNAAGYFKAMDDLDNQFKEVRQNYQLNVGELMDRQMLDDFLSKRGAAHRTVHKFGSSLEVPAGLNLGGYCMLRQQDSILFFHRMKLRNSTVFQVNYLHNDLENMALITRLGLNDLHLVGSYERSATHDDLSVLYYRPSYGTLEILLKNVNYKMEGRLRMMSDRMTLELINSELVINDDILISYVNTNLSNTPDYTVKAEPRNLDDFLQRLKTDLDLWLKDFFNDYLMYYELPEYDNTGFQEYEKKKTFFQNEYVNYAVNTIRQKIYNLADDGVKLPKFTLFSVPNIVLRIKDGVLRGLDTMHQRSVATGAKNNNMRIVDVIVGFSKLRAEYKFEAVLPNGTPPLTGVVIMSADEMTAHLGISLVTKPDSVDLNFDFIQQMKPETLTIEGPANRLIANFKHQLEHTLIALISNALIHNVKMLNTITRCSPFLYGKVDQDPFFGSESSGESMTKEESQEYNVALRNAKISKAKRRPIGRNTTRKIPQKNKKRL